MHLSYILLIRVRCDYFQNEWDNTNCRGLIYHSSLKGNTPFTGSTSSTVSWDHIFTSLNQYYSSLRRESPHAADSSTSYRLHSRVITPQELDGLLGVLKLVRKVCEQVILNFCNVLRERLVVCK